MIINSKALITLLLLFGFVSTYGQKGDYRGYQKIKEERKEFISEGLELTEEQEEKFWPVYNVYLEEVHTLMKANRKGRRKRKEMTEEEARQELDLMKALKRQELELQLTFYEDMEEVLTAKQILFLDYRERKFHEKVIEKFRNWRKKKEG